jgi:ATP-dependent DNA helicase RecQ
MIANHHPLAFVSDRPPTPRPDLLPGGAARGRALDDATLDRLLVERFGIARLYDWQREAIGALLASGGRVVLIAPTGGGKSLCYQLPAVALGGTTLVLSPLISLMEDQVRALEARGIPATFLASSLPWEESRRRLSELRRGAYAIVYAAPERLGSDAFLDALAATDLALVAVDEAHCIVQWGHDFRPDYLRIGEVLERLAPPRVLACTATATPEARDEIVRRLRFEPRALATVLRGFARPNLHLAVREVDGPREARLQTQAALLAALGTARAPKGAGIVYAATRKGTERIADELRAAGWDAQPYHAGLPAERRARVSATFAARELSVVVATNAFGMGIDRPDVRIVVHAQPPASIEAYYQEVGRAGRDGAPADGVLLFAASDIALRRRLCASSSSPDGAAPSALEVARAWGLFRELLRYVDAATCRHDFMLRYFGDDAESLGGCGHCDVCRDAGALEPADPDALERDADVVRRALAGVARAKGGAGMQAIAAMLRGERSARVAALGLDRLSTFGVLEGRSKDDVAAVLRVLIAAGWIDLGDGEFPMPVVTEPGWRVMRGDVPPRVRLPSAAARARAVRGTRRRSGSPGVPLHDGAPNGGLAAVRGTALFEALRAHRAELARTAACPAYVVATDRTLAEIAELRPRSAAELAGVHGMGPARVAKYGEDLLRIVREAAE